MAKIFNDYFTSIIKQIHVEKKESDPQNLYLSNNPVLQNCPSIFKSKLNQTYSGFSFLPVNYEKVLTELENLDMSTTLMQGIPRKIVMENLNNLTTFLVKYINTCIKKGSIS